MGTLDKTNPQFQLLDLFKPFDSINNNIDCFRYSEEFSSLLGKPQKESSFFSDSATKALPPKPRRT